MVLCKWVHLNIVNIPIFIFEYMCYVLKQEKATESGTYLETFVSI